MDKLTQFFSELLTNEDKLDRFNSGSSEDEIANNRQSMLSAAGVNYTKEMIRMTSQDLQKLMEKELSQKTGDDLKTTICGLIAKQMLEYPERTAIIDGEIKIDYKSLIKRANEVAGELMNRGIKPGSLVGVCMNRSWELIATLLGVMQAGCAYVPLDPTYPQDRIQYMLEHSRTVAAIVDNQSSANLCSQVPELLWINALGNHTDCLI